MSTLRAQALRLLLLLGILGTGGAVLAQPVTVPFHDRGNATTTMFREAAVTSTPALNPAVLTLTQWNGLGVTDSVFDPGESVEFAFDAPATDVSYCASRWTSSGMNSPCSTSPC